MGWVFAFFSPGSGRLIAAGQPSPAFVTKGIDKDLRSFFVNHAQSKATSEQPAD